MFLCGNFALKPLHIGEIMSNTETQMRKKPTRKRPYFTMESVITAILRDASGKMHHGILFYRRLLQTLIVTTIAKSNDTFVTYHMKLGNTDQIGIRFCRRIYNYLLYIFLYVYRGNMFFCVCISISRMCAMYLCLVFNCFVFFGVYCAKHWNRLKFIKKQKKRPVLEILSGLLSQLSAGGIASRYIIKSEDEA